MRGFTETRGPQSPAPSMQIHNRYEVKRKAPMRLIIAATRVKPVARMSRLFVLGKDAGQDSGQAAWRLKARPFPFSFLFPPSESRARPG